MDQRADAVEEDLKRLLRTRMALADKIQTLEQRVEETVQGAKNTALDAIETARDKAAEWVESTARQLDPALQAEARPWLLLGGAIVVGFAAGWLSQSRTGAVYPYYAPGSHGAGVMPSQGPASVRGGVYPFYPSRRLDPSRRLADRGEKTSFAEPGSEAATQLYELWDQIAAELRNERDRLQAAALEIGRSFVRDLARIAGETLLEQLAGGAPSARATRGGQNPKVRAA